MLAAYHRHVESMGAASQKAVDDAGPDPVTQLAAFISANLSPPILDPENLSLWAAFITTVRTNPLMANVHRDGYLVYRNEAERLLELVAGKSGRRFSAKQVRHLGITLNAIIGRAVAGRLHVRFGIRRRRTGTDRPVFSIGSPRHRARQGRAGMMRYASITERLQGLGSDKWHVHLKAKDLLRVGEPVIMLTIGEPDISVSDELMHVLEKSMRAGRTGYSNGRGEPSVLKALAAKYTKRTGRAINPENFVCFPRNPDSAVCGDDGAGGNRRRSAGRRSALCHL